MKRILLLGAGHSRKKMLRTALSPESDFNGADLVIHDIDPGVTDATLRFDLEELPYPLQSNSFDEIHAYEVLEHTGIQGDAEFFFRQFHSLWSALKPDGLLAISVPIWNTQVALGVPDHKRILPPCIFEFLSPEYEKRFGHIDGAADYSRFRGPLDLRIVGQKEDQASGRFYVLMRAVK